MFTVFNTNTIAWAKQMQSNFEYVGLGDRIPIDGVSMAATDLVNNLGSDVYRWKTLNANSLTYDYIYESKYLLYSGDVPFNTLTGFQVSVDGDRYNYYELSYYIEYNTSTVSTATASVICLSHTNSLTSNSYIQSINRFDPVVNSDDYISGNQTIGFPIGVINTDSYFIHGNCKIYLKSDQLKQAISNSCDSGNNVALLTSALNTITTATVTAIIFESPAISFESITSVNINLWGIE